MIDPGVEQIVEVIAVIVFGNDDLIVVVIYGIFFSANLLLWVKWQQRLVPKPEPAVEEGKVLRTSRFGRPVKSKV